MPDTYSFGIDPITCHAWNEARTHVAMAPNNNEVQIHQFVAGKWKQVETLSEHGQRVTGIDWAPRTNRIVTCGADRNAYVWTLQADKKWKPTLVVLRLNRAATCVRWSPKEDKFAVGSGARMVSVCYFEQDNDWWISKQIKKPIRSTVTCLDWHKDNCLIACGSTDFKARVFSGYIKEVDAKPGPTSWGSKMTFANLMGEYSNGGGGWVHGISFSESGDKLAWVGHDSSITVVDPAKEQDKRMTTVKTDYLPFMSILWITNNSLVVAGFDCAPMLYTYNGSNISYVSKLDDSDSKQQQGGKVSAMKRFKAMDSKAAETAVATTLSSYHQNTVTQISLHSGSKSKCSKFCTSGVDGQLVVWDVKSLESAIAGLRIA